MSFGAPVFLLGLLLVPLALAAYLASRARAKRYAVRFTATPALKLAAGTIPAWRKHLPAAALLAALVALSLALAKPQRTVDVPTDRASVVLVTDHSRSMLATDVEPDRMTAAKRAARAFLDELPRRLRVGVVTFSGAPDAVQAPSPDHREAWRVIDAQVADGATATGEALQSGIDALVRERRAGRRVPAAMILLSDGKTTIGRDPVEVARSARRLKIPISTVSLGTDAATVPSPGGLGPRLPAIPDPETLEQIAKTSGGRSFAAEDDEELSSIYKALGSQLGTREEKREITSAFAIGGLLLLLGAAATSVRWSGRLP